MSKDVADQLRAPPSKTHPVRQMLVERAEAADTIDSLRAQLQRMREALENASATLLEGSRGDREAVAESVIHALGIIRAALADSPAQKEVWIGDGQAIAIYEALEQAGFVGGSMLPWSEASVSRAIGAIARVLNAPAQSGETSEYATLEDAIARAKQEGA